MMLEAFVFYQALV